MSNNKEPLFAEERQREIINLLKASKKLLVPELCSYFGVSPATIRNDLNDLEGRGLLTRTHGGAILRTQTGYEPVSAEKQVKNMEEKNCIAEAALKLVKDGDTLVLDTGTTILAFAEKLSAKHRLTVITNDIKIALLLEEKSDASIILPGGIIRRGYNCLLGPSTAGSLSGYRVDKAFMASNALSLNGASTPDPCQGAVKSAVIVIAAEIRLLCDSSRLGSDSFAVFAPLDRINTVVTDSGVSAEFAATLEAHDINLITAGKNNIAG